MSRAPTPARTASARARPPSGPKLRRLREWFAPEMPRVRLLTALGLCRAGAEAAALLALAPLIAAIAAGETVALRLAHPALSGLGFEVPLEITAAQLLGLCAAALIARFAAHAASATITGGVVGAYETRLRARAHRSFLQMAPAAQIDQSVGALQASINVSITASARAIAAASRLFASGAAAAALLICALAAHAAAALSVLALGAAIFLGMRRVSGAAARRAQEQARLNARFGDRAAEAVALARSYRAFDVVEPVAEAFEADAARYGRLAGAVWTFRELTPALYQFLASLGVLAALLGLFLLGRAEGPVDIAPIIVVVLLALRAFSYGQVAQGAYHNVVELTPYVDELRAEIDRFESRPARFGAVAALAFERLVFDDVHYVHGSGGGLRGISFALRRGQSVGVVGPSGAGKSTLLSLALGLATPQAGRVTANGAPITDYAAAAWFGQVGYVPQEPRLFRGDVLANIRFHRAHVSEADAIEAAERAGLADEIRALAEGFGADIGERGERLSGGQRQRLAIARALAGRPALLVMDEPTSALDFEADAVIQAALKAARGEAAVLVAAHRAATLADCDQVIALEAGRIVEISRPGAGRYLARAAAAQDA